MASPTSVIADAFQRLQRAVSPEDAHDFASTELKDVWTAVRDIESAQRKRQSNQNLRRIEPLLRGFEKYSKVIEVLCNGTPYMPYAWAPIKLMLQLASNHRDVFEALLTAYADIGDALPRFDRYEKAFNNNPEFQNVLASVYSSILDFHQRAYKFFRRRAWHLLFLSLWKDFGSRFENIISSLKKQRDFLDKEAQSFDIVEGKESRLRVQDDIEQRQKRDEELLEQNERTTRIAQLQHSVNWLSIDDKDQETEYERISHRRHDETCEWIMKEARMKSWMKGDTKSSVLWLSGKPGAGKSVMCSYIIQSLADVLSLNTCYYFCNSHESGNISHKVLRTVAIQLLRRHLDIASLIANEFVYRGLNCGLSQLRVLIPQMLEIVPDTRILMDGLDECSPENQRAVLKDIQAICVGPEIRCKVLFSSRREVPIYEKLSSKPQILLDGREEVDSDIRSYVKYKVTKLRTSDENLLNMIESILVEKANGMFLWVRLVVEELKYCYNDASLEERATTLPKGLKEAYGRILERIMDDEKSDHGRAIAIRILEWMACSKRTLKVYEILDGIALFPGCTTLTARTKMRKDVLDLCRPLIEDGPSNSVDFVHFSAKEYILNEECRGRKPFLQIEEAHFGITFACVAHLNSSIDLLHGSQEDRAALIAQGLHGLQLYANQFWYKHLIIYFDLLRKKGIPPPLDLLEQLSLLLAFQRDQSATAVPLPKQLEELVVLDGLPRVKELVSKIMAFRNGLNRDELFDKSPEDISETSCITDPTYCSAARHLYRSTLEALLNDRAARMFPQISEATLREFREIFGPSAYICRYLHCARATDGFDSMKQREIHEATHQRKFRCAHPSCAYFSSGFATRGALNKHNERYHEVIKDDKTFASAIKSRSERSRAKAMPTNSHEDVELGPILNHQMLSIIRKALYESTVASEPSSWQAGTLIQERVSNALNIISHLRLESLHKRNPPTLQEIHEIGVKLEIDIFQVSFDKTGYENNIKAKMDQLLKGRAQNQAANQDTLAAEHQPPTQSPQVEQAPMQVQNPQTQHSIIQEFQQNEAELQAKRQTQIKVHQELDKVRTQMTSKEYQNFYRAMLSRFQDGPLDPEYILTMAQGFMQSPNRDITEFGQAPQEDVPWVRTYFDDGDVDPHSKSGIDTTPPIKNLYGALSSIFEHSTIRCVCHSTAEDDFMIACGSCNKWLHCACINISFQNLPPVYNCTFCTYLNYDGQVQDGVQEYSESGAGKTSLSPPPNQDYYSRSPNYGGVPKTRPPEGISYEDGTSSGVHLTPNAKTELVDEGQYIIKCICGYTEEDGNTIYCDTCDMWQHIECYYFGRPDEVPKTEFDHRCLDCRPRRVLISLIDTSRRAKQRIEKFVGNTGDNNFNSEGHRCAISDCKYTWFRWVEFRTHLKCFHNPKSEELLAEMMRRSNYQGQLQLLEEQNRKRAFLRALAGKENIKLSAPPALTSFGVSASASLLLSGERTLDYQPASPQLHTPSSFQNQALTNFQIDPQRIIPQDTVPSLPPAGLNAPQNSRQISRYWNISEKKGFPTLLRHFGTEWPAIANYMGTKTPFMVKSYYEIEIDLGRSDLKAIAESADELRSRGEPTGPLPRHEDNPVPPKNPPGTFNINQLWERFAAHDLVRNGELDIDRLSKEMQKVAWGDGSNVLINEVDFEWIMEHSIERFRNKTPSRVYCQQCSNFPEGFFGDNELRRHHGEHHGRMITKWICVERHWDSRLVVPFLECKACTGKGKYDTYQDAALHLRRCHLRPQGLGNLTSLESLKGLIEEIEEPVEKEAEKPSNLSIYSAPTDTITYGSPQARLNTAEIPDLSHQVSGSSIHQQVAFEVPRIEVEGRLAFSSVSPPIALPRIQNSLTPADDALSGITPAPGAFTFHASNIATQPSPPLEYLRDNAKEDSPLLGHPPTHIKNLDSEARELARAENTPPPPFPQFSTIHSYSESLSKKYSCNVEEIIANWIKASNGALTVSAIMNEALYTAKRYKDARMHKKIIEDPEWLPNLRRKYGLLSSEGLLSTGKDTSTDMASEEDYPVKDPGAPHPKSWNHKPDWLDNNADSSNWMPSFELEEWPRDKDNGNLLDNNADSSNWMPSSELEEWPHDKDNGNLVHSSQYGTIHPLGPTATPSINPPDSAQLPSVETLFTPPPHLEKDQSLELGSMSPIDWEDHDSRDTSSVRDLGSISRYTDDEEELEPARLEETGDTASQEKN